MNGKLVFSSSFIVPRSSFASPGCDGRHATLRTSKMGFDSSRGYLPAQLDWPSTAPVMRSVWVRLPPLASGSTEYPVPSTERARYERAIYPLGTRYWVLGTGDPV
jgi:hypothetical protein